MIDRGNAVIFLYQSPRTLNARLQPLDLGSGFFQNSPALCVTGVPWAVPATRFHAFRDSAKFLNDVHFSPIRYVRQ